MKLENKGENTLVFHITDVSNLRNIIASGSLLSDAKMVQASGHTVIGYNHIKQRRLEEIKIPHSNRYVGEYVPFYFCPRSPMLYTINNGNTGKPVGCQKTILHLVSTVGHGMRQTNDWVISDGNAGSFATSYEHGVDALGNLNRDIIASNSWSGQSHQKAAEFLVADNFLWKNILGIICYDANIKAEIQVILQQADHKPVVKIRRDWYY